MNIWELLNTKTELRVHKTRFQLAKASPRVASHSRFIRHSLRMSSRESFQISRRPSESFRIMPTASTSASTSPAVIFFSICDRVSSLKIQQCVSKEVSNLCIFFLVMVKVKTGTVDSDVMTGVLLLQPVVKSAVNLHERQ